MGACDETRVIQDKAREEKEVDVISCHQVYLAPAEEYSVESHC